MAYPEIEQGGPTVIVFPDPVELTLAWLKRFARFTRVHSSLPANFKQRLPFVVVRDSGGPGIHDEVYSRARLQFECWAANSTESSAAARELAAVIRAWDRYEDVWRPRLIQEPTYMPDPDTGIPVHRLAAEVSFVGEEQAVPIL